MTSRRINTSEENGFFTAAVKRVWNGGNFSGDYDEFYEAVKADLVAAHCLSFEAGTWQGYGSRLQLSICSRTDES